MSHNRHTHTTHKHIDTPAHIHTYTQSHRDTLLGIDLVVLGIDVLVLGIVWVGLGIDSVVLGINSVVLGIDGLVLGIDLIVLGIDSVVLGIDLYVLGIDLLALGIDLVILGIDFVVLGITLTALRPLSLRVRITIEGQKTSYSGSHDLGQTIIRRHQPRFVMVSLAIPIWVHTHIQHCYESLYPFSSKPLRPDCC